MTPRPIIIVVPYQDGACREALAPLAACARAIAALAPAPIRAVVAGPDPLAAAQETAKRLGVPVTALQIAGSTDPCDGAVVAELAALLKSWPPGWILLADTTIGRHLASALAARLSAACIAGVEAVGGDQEGIVLTRAVYGGKFRAAVRAETATAVMTLQSGAFTGQTGTGGRSAAVELRQGTAADHRRRFLERRPGGGPDPGLSQARVVVAAGNGIGRAERLDLVRSLADRLAGAVVAGSRPVCDRGWLPYNRQVGITGTTVAPALYIACGISGAAQHVAGMSGAGLVVAINKDPKAAIFNHADIGVVEDLETFLPLLIESGATQNDKDLSTVPQTGVSGESP
jgi:electron transfer flavoprotein alpha subunit